MLSPLQRRLLSVRAGMVNDPGEYRWSGYGEAVGGGSKGDGKRAREGIIRAWMAHKGWPGNAKYWDGGGKRHGNIHADYRAMLLFEGVEQFKEVSDERSGALRLKLERKGMAKAEVEAELKRLEAGRGVAIAKRLRWRLRYLSDGAVIGQRSFVDEVFRECRDQFGARRKDGARRLRGDAAELTKVSGLWSLRDLGKSCNSGVKIVLPFGSFTDARQTASVRHERHERHTPNATRHTPHATRHTPRVSVSRVRRSRQGLRDCLRCCASGASFVSVTSA